MRAWSGSVLFANPLLEQVNDVTTMLEVDLHGHHVGDITRRGNQVTFALSEKFLDTPGRPVLGQIFEENPRAKFVSNQGLPTWFGNLLPEPGQLRSFLVSRLQVRDDDLNLLAALGGDLPGAVTIRESTDEPRAGWGDRPSRAVEDALLLESSVPIGIKFSMAGVQLKLSMVRDYSAIRLAGRGESGDVLVKFPAAMPSLPLNEHAAMTLAGHCGIQVPEIGLIELAALGDVPDSFLDTEGLWAYWIKRFDRTPDGPIHMEDINQVIGNRVADKYQGLSEEGLGGLIARLCGEEDFWEYLRRLVFNIAIGNEDSHLKNWSLIYPDRINPRLSPLYDVASTVVVPGLDRGHALRLGKDRRAATFGMSSIRRVAEKASFSGDVAEDVASRVLGLMREAEPIVRECSPLPSSVWARLDDYRATVPLLTGRLP